TPLHRAARWSNPEMVMALLNAGAEIEAHNEDGDTPLHRAARWSNPEMVMALLNAGADPGARNRAGKQPADLAKNNEQVRNHDVFWILHDGRFD
ncbi:MAG: ankyrin repeat domain-containing protein, partial [Rhodobacteraceae bacterium]|nr:ankyrin repeat domain-containing protein [Paracoccaceae bacterium]